MSIYTDHGQISKLWGYEKIIVNDVYCGKIVVVYPNKKASSVRFHKKHATLHILDGYIEIEIFRCLKKHGGTEFSDYIVETRATLAPGMSLAILPGVAHRFWTRSEVARFIELSTNDQANDTYRLVESGDVPKI